MEIWLNKTNLSFAGKLSSASTDGGLCIQKIHIHVDRLSPMCFRLENAVPITVKASASEEGSYYALPEITTRVDTVIARLLLSGEVILCINVQEHFYQTLFFFCVSTKMK